MVHYIIECYIREDQSFSAKSMTHISSMFTWNCIRFNGNVSYLWHKFEGNWIRRTMFLY